MAVIGCYTSTAKVTEMLREHEKNRKQGVNIIRFHCDYRTVFGRNGELPSNPNGIYFFADVGRRKVKFTFIKNTATLEYVKSLIKVTDECDN